MDILSYILSKKYTDNAVSSITSFKVHVVDSLPSSGVANTFYLVSSAESSNSILYIWAENTGSFEQVGTTELTLGNYYTKDEVTALLNSIKVDLTGYATETWVKEAINAIKFPEEYDDTELRNLINNKADRIHTHDQYLTKQQALAEYAKKSELFSGDYNDLSNKPVIPSIEGLATENYVKNAIAEAELNDKEVDLTGYATKDDVAEAISKIEFPTTDLSNYYNKQEIDAKIENIEHPTVSLEGYATEDYVNKAIENISIKADNTIGLDFVTDITVGHLEAGSEIKASMTIGELLHRILVACAHEYGDWVITKQPEVGVPGERQKTCRLCGHVVTEVIPALKPEEPQSLTYLTGTFGNLDIQEWPEPYIDNWEPNERDEISMHYVNNMLTNTAESESDLVGRHGFAIKTPFVKESKSAASWGDVSTEPYTTNPAILLPAGYKVIAWNTDADNSSLSEQVVNSYTLSDGRIVYYTPTYVQQTEDTVTHYLTITKN